MKIRSAEFIKSAEFPPQFPDDALPEIAFAGRSNVGKSSLINTLVNRKNLAQTSNTPGRTRLINFFRINDLFYFVDLPGYGYARVPAAMKKKWGPMVERYLGTRQTLRLVIVILDVRRDLSPDDRSLIDWLEHYAIPALFVITKTDKLSRHQIRIKCDLIKASLAPSPAAVIPFSARSGSGRDEVWKHITDVLSR
ncbi:MAG: YihA family ribosome biogenesis GTP-binding protein [Deltaproteobacteria bacterium]|nr:YihA family ribosome biogenesis GTP-binding protein [Deltaproteobacteria bacterium]